MQKKSQTFASTAPAVLTAIALAVVASVIFNAPVRAAEALPDSFAGGSASLDFTQPASNPLALSPDILLLLRIANLQESGEKANRLQRAIIPDNAAFSRDILQAIGNYLRNPGLDNIPGNAFFELLLFTPREDRRSALVVAFPVKEPQTYIRLLANRASMSSQVAPDGIVHLQEQNLVTTDFYLGATSKRIAIFGRNRDAVSRARELYENSGNCLSPKPAGDVELYLHAKRLFSVYATGITGALENLHRDLVTDLTAGHPGLAAPAERLVAAALADLKGLAEEISKIHLSLDLAKSLAPPAANGMQIPGNSGEILVRAEINFEPGKISQFLYTARPRPAGLVKLLPARTIAFDWSAHEFRGSGRIIAGFAGELGNAFSEPLDAASQEALAKLLAGFLGLGVTEMATGTVAAPAADQGGHYPRRPSYIILAKLSAPERFELFLDEARKIFATDSPLLASLKRNRVSLNFTQTPIPAAGLNAKLVAVTLKIMGKEEPGAARPVPIVLSTSYQVLLTGNLLACATGPAAGMLLRDFAKTAARQQAAFAASPLGKNTMGILGNDRFLWVGMFAPIPYLNMALQAEPSFRGGLSLETPTQNREAPGPPLPSTNKNTPPFIMTLTPFDSGRQPAAMLSIHLPRNTLRQVMQALLDASPRNQ